jgi:hypothetical protein
MLAVFALPFLQLGKARMMKAIRDMEDSSFKRLLLWPEERRSHSARTWSPQHDRFTYWLGKVRPPRH